MKNKLIIILLLFTLIITSGFGCKRVKKETQQAMQPIVLNYWRVWDGQDAFDEIIKNYKAQHPFVTINYRQLRYDEYEYALLEALAEDKGPDIFSIHNTWTKKYQSKIAPMPAETSMVFPVVKGTLKKETFYELRTKKSITLKELKDTFIDAVYQDVVLPEYNKKEEKLEDKIVALPLSVDTLAMYYNKDLLNQAGITEPATYWNKELQEHVKKLTKLNSEEKIIQSGINLGGSKNIERYSDILSVLMMQSGAVMMDDSGKVLFHQIPSAFYENKYSPSVEALRFYTDFANPAKEVYSWNNNLDNSLDMFIQGRLALMLGYSYHLPIIKARAPKLNFSITKLPQIEGSSQAVNFANYWVETVSKKSKNTETAWDFLQFMAEADQIKSYLEKTKKPTALRALINEQLEDADIKIFASQLLTAKSWYKGTDSNAAEFAIGEMIDSVNNGQENIREIIEFGAKKVQETIIR